MGYNNKLPEWKNEGIEPSNDLKTNGFKENYKPPAQIFNWFWSKVTKSITELQNKAVVKGNLLNADLNEATETGIYRFNVPVANKPPITYGQLLVLHGEGDTIAQIAFGYEGKIYYRSGNPASVGGNGNWTEWLRVYDEKSTVPIAHGGTGATTAAGALSTLGAAAAKHKGQHNRMNGADPITLSDVAYFGTNPIDLNDSTSDTIQNWVDKGSGYCYYAKEGDYGAQPSRYGQLVNLITGADVFQLWHTLPKGPNFIRCGSGSAGWTTGWVKVYDEANKPTPKEIGIDTSSLFYADAQYPTCLYRTVNGVKEWLNPPMKNRVEYRTTERFNGSPVYVQQIDLTTAAVGNFVDYHIATTEDDQGLYVVDIKGTLLDTQDHNSFYSFPVIIGGTIAATADIITQAEQGTGEISWNLAVHTLHASAAQYPVQIVIKYTKG